MSNDSKTPEVLTDAKVLCAGEEAIRTLRDCELSYEESKHYARIASEALAAAEAKVAELENALRERGNVTIAADLLHRHTEGLKAQLLASEAKVAEQAQTIEAAEATFDDEQAAHAETLALLEATKKQVAEHAREIETFKSIAGDGKEMRGDMVFAAGFRKGREESRAQLERVEKELETARESINVRVQVQAEMNDALSAARAEVEALTKERDAAVRERALNLKQANEIADQRDALAAQLGAAKEMMGSATNEMRGDEWRTMRVAFANFAVNPSPAVEAYVAGLRKRVLEEAAQVAIRNWREGNTVDTAQDIRALGDKR